MLSIVRSLKFKNEYFIFLLPLFFVLHGFNEHFDAIPVADAALLLLKYFSVIIILSFLFFLFLKSLTKAFFICLFILSFHLFFGSFHESIKQIFGNIFITRYGFILPVAFITLIVLIVLLKKSKKEFKKLIYYLNFLFILLISVEGILLIQKTIRRKTSLPAEIVSCNDCNKPDVFLIISDTYAGKKQLQEVFNFDNTPFEDSLNARGFHNIQNTTCNYKNTIYSMASMLNMNYLADGKGAESYEQINLLYSEINNSVVVNFFKRNDYSIENFSLFKLGNNFPYINNIVFRTGTQLLTKHTLLSRLKKDLGYHFVTTVKVDPIIKKFKKEKVEALWFDKYRDSIIIHAALKRAAEKANHPRFFYIHIYQPHGPSYFDKNGNPLPKGLSQEEEFIESLQYTNKQVLKLVDGIFKRTKDPIILFMGDHGFRLGNIPYSYTTANSVYLPKKNYTGFYDGISHVNQFRVLLNTIYNQNLPLLKDSTATR